jgi:hypothetical protein
MWHARRLTLQIAESSPHILAELMIQFASFVVRGGNEPAQRFFGPNHILGESSDNRQGGKRRVLPA